MGKRRNLLKKGEREEENKDFSTLVKGRSKEKV
jgi:hypothetical protein